MSKAVFGQERVPTWFSYLFNLAREGKSAPIRFCSRKVCSRYLKLSRRSFDVVIDGIKFRLSPKNNLHDRIMMRDGKIPEDSWFDDLFGPLPDNGVFVDIGANIGVISLSAWSKAGRSCAFSRLNRTQRCASDCSIMFR